MTDGTFVAFKQRYSSITTNESDWNPVKGSVSGNGFNITCQDNQSTDTVSWMVLVRDRTIILKNHKLQMLMVI